MIPSILKNKFILLLSYAVLIVACTKNSTQNDSRIVTYFDLKTYFENEIQELNQNQKSVKKTVVYNNKKELHRFSNMNWEKELAIFKESDINKAAWKNSYTKDTILKNNLRTIEYKAKESSLAIRYVSITEDLTNQKLTNITIRSINRNNLYNSFQVLNYKPGISYSIIGNQKVRLLKETTYSVLGQF